MHGAHNARGVHAFLKGGCGTRSLRTHGKPSMEPRCKDVVRPLKCAARTSLFQPLKSNPTVGASRISLFQPLKCRPTHTHCLIHTISFRLILPCHIFEYFLPISYYILFKYFSQARLILSSRHSWCVIQRFHKARFKGEFMVSLLWFSKVLCVCGGEGGGGGGSTCWINILLIL